MRLTDLLSRIPADTPASTADRLVEVLCALQLTPDSAVADGAYAAGKIATLAGKFDDWLKTASDEQDRQIRRVLLLMLCDKADPSTPVDRIRALAKELHHYVTRKS